jgi:signal transduction histidine kinase
MLGWMLFVASAFMARSFAPREFDLRGRTLTAESWMIGLELGIRYASLAVALVLVTRTLARRLPATGFRAATGVLFVGTLLGTLSLAFLNLMSCVVVPWGICTFDDQWLAGRFLALPTWLFISIGLLLAWIVAFQADNYAADEIRAHRLRADLAQARTGVLVTQLRPHFLFNTLQSAAALIHSDPPAAQDMIRGIRELFHRSSGVEGDALVTLAQEVSFLELYTKIESIRFGDRLAISIEIDDVARPALIPHLILQPLVENSIHHAVGRRGEGEVNIRAQVDRRRDWLTLVVADNGPGLNPSQMRSGSGLGVANTRARLEIFCGNAYSLDLLDRSDQGMTVTIKIPYSTDPEPVLGAHGEGDPRLVGANTASGK